MNLDEGQLASELQGSACVCPPGLGLQVCAAVPVFVTWALAIQIQVLSASTLLTEPSSQPLSCSFTEICFMHHIVHQLKCLIQ